MDLEISIPVQRARYNRGSLLGHEIPAAGTTARLLSEEVGIPAHRLQSGPLGGDQQVGAKITESQIDFLSRRR